MKLIRGYGILKRLHRGARAYCYLTFRCNLACPYCGNNLLLKDKLHSRTAYVFNEISVDDWVEVITKFPMKIREVVLTGGEPFMRDDTAELINKLTEKGIFVTIFTNFLLMPRNEIKPSIYLHIIATLHNLSEDSRRGFWLKYKRLKRKYRITLDIISTKDTRRYWVRNKRKKHIQTFEEMKKDECWWEPRLHILPDGGIHISERDAITHAQKDHLGVR